MNTLKLIAIAFSAVLLTSCASGPDRIRVGITGKHTSFGKHILGVDIVVCSTKIKWQAGKLVVEGVQNNAGSTTVAKSFALGRAEFSSGQIHKLDRIAMLLDLSLARMCRLEEGPAADDPAVWNNLVKENTKTLEKIAALIANLEKANLDNTDPAKAEEAQSKVIEASNVVPTGA